MPLPSTGYLTTTIATAPGSAITDFSWLVDLSQFVSVLDFWTACTSSVGLKLRCALDSDGTELPFDVWGFDNVGAKGYLRIKVPSFTGTQTLRIYPSDSGNADYATPTNAYDSNWAGYWPLSSDANDRTAASNDLTNNGGITIGGATGKFGDATTLASASNQYFSTTGVPFTAEPATMIAWCKKVDKNASDDAIVMCRGNSSNYEEQDLVWSERTFGDNHRASASNPNGSASVTTNVSGPIALDDPPGWSFLAGTYDNDSTQIYAEGSSASANTTSTNFTAPTGFKIGERFRAGTNNIDADVQDCQLHSVVRSSEWIAQEYSQTNDNAAFWGDGTWNAASGGGLSIPVARHHYQMQLQGAF